MVEVMEREDPGVTRRHHQGGEAEEWEMWGIGYNVIVT